MAELSKSDKKIARVLIQQGLIVEFEKGLQKASTILTSWKEKEKDVKTSYYDLFGHIQKFDKHIARRYDNMGNSTMLFVLCQQINEGLVKAEDVATLSEEGQAIIQRIRGL